MARSSIPMFFPILPICLALAACGGPTYVRGSEAPGIDDAAMGTGIDRRDMQQLLHENLKSLMWSPVAHQWDAERSRPTFAIYPLANEASAHHDRQLQPLVSDIQQHT